MAFKKVKGTVDYFPEEKIIQEKVFGLFRDIACKYSFQEVESPAFEHMDLLTAKSGDEIKSQIFALEKRSREELGLRFEFTASIARMFVSRQKELAKPVRWFSIGRMWRYEQPQAGRLREFYQFNAEIFGSDRPECDAEVINLSIDALLCLGLRKYDFYVKINNRKLLQGLLQDIVPKGRIDDVLRIIDKKSKITGREFEDELKFLEKSKIKEIRDLLAKDFKEIGKMKMSLLAQEGYQELENILKYLDSDIVKFDIGTARGLAYYSGMVFEIFDSKGKYRALCGGGRYDQMIGIFGGQKTPATGFAIGYATVSMLLEDKGLFQKDLQGPDYFIAIIGDVKKEAMDLAKRLRKNNSVSYDLNLRNLANQLKYAKTINSKKIIVFGPDELKSRRVKVKDTKTGNEKTVRIESLI